MKRKLCGIAMAFFCVLCLFAMPGDLAYGREADYIIRDYRDLRDFSEQVKNNPSAFRNTVVKLAGDISFPEGSISNFTPIPNFSGTFDGGWYSISGLNVVTTDTNAGLFASASGTIKNLTVRDSSFRNTNSYSNTCSGAVVGDGRDATIINCHNVNSSVSTTYGYLGGVAGWAKKMLNCSSSGTVSHAKRRYVGGVAGYVDEICNSCNLGRVEAALEQERGFYTGGVAGSAGRILNCYNAGAVLEAESQAAGIAGEVRELAFSCYNNENVTDKKISSLGTGAAQEDVEHVSSEHMKSEEFLIKLNQNGGGNDDWLEWVFRSGSPYPRHVLVSRISDHNTKVTLPQESYEYTGEEQVPEVTVEYKGEKLQEGADYKLDFQNNVEPGEAVVTVEGCGRYTGSMEARYKILPIDLSRAKITLSRSYYLYSATRCEPSVTVTVNGIDLYDMDLDEEGAYEVSYQNNVNAGTAAVVVTGTGRYCTGTAIRYFTIAKRESSASMLGSYTTEYKTAPFYIGVGNGTGATYQSSNPAVVSVDASTGRVTVKGIGKAVITATVPESVNYNGKTLQTVITVKPRRQTAKISSVRKKAMTVKWKKEPKATGYQIEYSTKKNFISAKKTFVKKSKTTSKKIKGLKTGKRYYVRTRAYKEMMFYGNKITIYGEWSKAARSGKIK